MAVYLHPVEHFIPITPRTLARMPKYLNRLVAGNGLVKKGPSGEDTVDLKELARKAEIPLSRAYYELVNNKIPIKINGLNGSIAAPPQNGGNGVFAGLRSRAEQLGLDPHNLEDRDLSGPLRTRLMGYYKEFRQLTPEQKDFWGNALNYMFFNEGFGSLRDLPLEEQLETIKQRKTAEVQNRLPAETLRYLVEELAKKLVNKTGGSPWLLLESDFFNIELPEIGATLRGLMKRDAAEYQTLPPLKKLIYDRPVFYLLRKLGVAPFFNMTRQDQLEILGKMPTIPWGLVPNPTKEYIVQDYFNNAGSNEPGFRKYRGRTDLLGGKTMRSFYRFYCLLMADRLEFGDNTSAFISRTFVKPEAGGISVTVVSRKNPRFIEAMKIKALIEQEAGPGRKVRIIPDLPGALQYVSVSPAGRWLVPRCLIDMVREGRLQPYMIKPPKSIGVDISSDPGRRVIVLAGATIGNGCVFNGKTTIVGIYAVLGDRVAIGENVIIGGSVRIGQGSVIEDDVVLKPWAKINYDTEIKGGTVVEAREEIKDGLSVRRKARKKSLM